MSLSKTRDFLAQNKKAILILITALLVFFPDFAFAEGSTLAADANTFIQGGFKIIGALLGLLTSFVSMFLSPGWVNGEIFGMTKYLKEIWILVSNVVYFIFAFILIAIAFMNIMGKGDKWELKQALPKFIVGVLMVPFSWFFVQFVISISAILTVSVLSLPYDSFGDKINEKAGDKEICVDYILTLGETKTTGAVATTTTGGSDGKINEFIRCATDSKKKTLSKLLQGDGDSVYSIISIYTYGIISMDAIDTLTKTNFTDKGGIGKITDVLIKLIFDGIFIVVYFILMVALFLALFTRGIGLWLYAMFSPLFGLFYFFGGEGGGELGKKFSLKEFIGLALVPVYVSAALSFGLLFLFVSSHSIVEENASGNTIFKDDSINFGGFSFKIEGVTSNSGAGKTDPKNFNNLIFANGIGGVIGKLIMEMFGLAILWMAVMAALKSSTITEKVSQPIADFGKSVGDLVMKSPTYVPILPGRMSVGGLQQAGSMTKTHFENKSIKSGSDFVNKHTSFGSDSISAKQLANEINNGQLSREEIRKFRKEIAGKSMTEIANDVNLRDLVNSLGKKLNIEGEAKHSDRTSVSELLYKIHNDDKLSSIDNNRLYGKSKLSDHNEDTLNTKNAGLSSTGNLNSNINNNNSSVIAHYDNNTNNVIRVELANKTIHLKNGGKKIEDDSLDKFAKGLNLQEKSIIKEQFENAGVNNFDDLYNQLITNDKYKKSISEANGIIKFDSSKVNIN